MVWYQDKLLVTASANDAGGKSLYVYDMNRIQHASVDSPAVGRVPGGWSAHGYGYVMPAVASYSLAGGTCDPAADDRRPLFRLALPGPQFDARQPGRQRVVPGRRRSAQPPVALLVQPRGRPFRLSRRRRLRPRERRRGLLDEGHRHPGRAVLPVAGRGEGGLVRRSRPRQWWPARARCGGRAVMPPRRSSAPVTSPTPVEPHRLPVLLRQPANCGPSPAPTPTRHRSASCTRSR